MEIKTKILKPEEVSEEEIEKEEKETAAEEIKEEDELAKEKVEVSVDIQQWKPKTELGRKVKSGEITSIDYIFDNGLMVKEVEIIDILLPNLETDLLLIGQSKGKFGGGKRRIFKQTQKKTSEGNKPKFATVAVVGNGHGIVGLGYGKSKETLPAREKALRNAKLNLIRIKKGCGSWECGCGTGHSLPYAIEGKCGSVRMKIMPAPKGTGLRVESECSKILKFAGIRDAWSRTFGQTNTKFNHVYACFDALRKSSSTKMREGDAARLGMAPENN